MQHSINLMSIRYDIYVFEKYQKIFFKIFLSSLKLAKTLKNCYAIFWNSL